MAAVLAASGTAAADGAKAERAVVGAELALAIDPSKGFVDDPFTFDADNRRLLFVNSDTAELTNLVVYDMAGAAPLMTVPIGRFTSAPVRVEFAPGNNRFFVVAPVDGGGVVAALIDAKGRVVRKFGPATDLVRIDHDGKPAVVAYTRSEVKRRGKAPGPIDVAHQVTIYDLNSGRRIGKVGKLLVNPGGVSKNPEFTLKLWQNGYTTAVGIKGGEYDPKEDQRSPDAEGWLRMDSGKFTKQSTIKDVIAHTEVMERLAGHDNEVRFVDVARNLGQLDLVAGNVAHKVALAEPFHHYEPGSLMYRVSRDGRVQFSLTIDPVNPDAAAKRRAVKAWMDLYEIAPGSTKAVRRARVLVNDKRRIDWFLGGDHLALVPRHLGFDRGGEKLLLYRLVK